MPIYSFRAECSADLECFYRQCAAANLVVSMRVKPEILNMPEPLSDPAVEMDSEASLDQLRGALRQVSDGLVMLQTLRHVQLADNTL